MREKTDYLLIFLLFLFVSSYSIHNFKTYHFMKETRDETIKIKQILEEMRDKND